MRLSLAARVLDSPLTAAVCVQERAEAISLSNSDRSNHLESATMAAYKKVEKDMDKLEADLARVRYLCVAYAFMGKHLSLGR